MVDAGGIAGIVIGVLVGFPLLLAVVLEVNRRVTARKFNVKGKHVYITGGSKGLGKALAQILLERGANVTIVASQQASLDAAVADLAPVVANTGQSLVALKADLTDDVRAAAVFHEAVAKQGNVPEYVFCCAGISIPKFFLDVKIQEFRDTLNINYMAAVVTAQTAIREYVRSGQNGNVVFISSLVGMFSLIGYSSYSPTKFALRGLAEALRSEFEPFGVKFHVYIPGSINTPGFEHENKVKPDILKKIEETDTIHSAESTAKALVKGIERGEFLISIDLVGDLARGSGRCAAPGNNFVIDSVYAFIGWIGFPVWRILTDSEIASWVKKEGKKFPSAADKLD